MRNAGCGIWIKKATDKNSLLTYLKYLISTAVKKSGGTFRGQIVRQSYEILLTQEKHPCYILAVNFKEGFRRSETISPNEMARIKKKNCYEYA